MISFVLALQCANRPGIVAAVASSIASHGGDILEAAQFDDVESGNFFMRIKFAQPAEAAPTFRESFTPLAETFGIQWTLRRTDEKRKVLVLVSAFDHCLVDLLYLVRLGELNMTCVGVVSNHPKDMMGFELPGDVPFHHFPISPATKPAQEAKIRETVIESGAELVVLARYMQILSDELSHFISGRCINIHHSFLPGFKGAKPYHQAHHRGVKMIGATAHYVTSDLDEGPIIAQDVEQVTHADTAEELVRKGRDIERRVLGRAVSLHLQDRVMINGGKTVVFP